MVRAPGCARLSEIEDALRQNTGWILEGLDKLAARGLPRPARSFTQGEKLPYCGQDLSLALHTCFSPRGAIRRRGGELNVHVPLDVPDEERAVYVRKMLGAWYRQRARQELASRLERFCALLGMPMPVFKISRGKSRWGTCSSQGVIHLNWRLLLLPPELCDYVVAHEACHLRQLDHSPRFWELLRGILPLAQELRARLDSEAPLYQLD